jgi:hypothetical protein
MPAMLIQVRPSPRLGPDWPQGCWRKRNIRSIRELGRREWPTRSGCSTRSPAENTIFRYKTMIGRCKRSRTFAGPRVEVLLACGILHTMTLLGMRDSYRVG